VYTWERSDLRSREQDLGAARIEPRPADHLLDLAGLVQPVEVDSDLLAVAPLRDAVAVESLVGAARSV